MLTINELWNLSLFWLGIVTAWAVIQGLRL